MLNRWSLNHNPLTNDGELKRKLVDRYQYLQFSVNYMQIQERLSQDYSVPKRTMLRKNESAKSSARSRVKLTQPSSKSALPKATAKLRPAKTLSGNPIELVGLHEWRGHGSKGVSWEVHCGDVNAVLSNFENDRFSCVVTSPPYYWQRDYGVQGQLGLESTIDGYVTAIADTMDQVRRVLATDGCLFLNLGDTYYSGKGQPCGKDPKNKARRFGLRAVDASGLGVPRKTAIGIPWRVALEMISRGWILRSPIIWAREGTIPEPTAKDRPWRTYENIFLFSKSPRYYFDRAALGDCEDIWTISDRPSGSNGIHSAAFPDRLVEKCLAIGCQIDGEVLDPFVGTGTVLRVAARSGRRSVGIDLCRKFCEHAVTTLDADTHKTNSKSIGG